MYKIKKPTAAQLKVLQKMNASICIVKQYSHNQVLWIRLFNYQESRFIGTRNENPIGNKTLEILIFNEWVKIDHSKNTDAHFYYFITEKGKAAANEKEK